jgi:hypothetical protein
MRVREQWMSGSKDTEDSEQKPGAQAEDRYDEPYLERSRCKGIYEAMRSGWDRRVG